MALTYVNFTRQIKEFFYFNHYFIMLLIHSFISEGNRCVSHNINGSAQFNVLKLLNLILIEV